MERASLSTGEFVGRVAELELLEGAWRAKASAFVPIYGRRRIGKSELVLRFMRDKRGVYHVGKEAPAALQVREFLEEAARALDEPLLAQASVDGWGAAIDLVVQRWRGPGKLVLALDEFQWTVGASPELPSLLQERWDRQWRKQGNVFLILCGSFVGFMEREVLGKESPLFGRRTAQIHLQPFGFREAALFHPGWSRANQARVYFVCGGVPLYLRMFAPGRSVEQGIVANLLSEFAPLFREPEFLLREELRDVEGYHAVLMAIAAGRQTVADLAAFSGMPARSVPYYLEQLVRLGYVARRHPLMPGRRNTRVVRFVLEDALLRFWFRFVFPHQSFITQAGPARTFTELVKPALDAYWGACFERLCREALPALYAAEGVRGRHTVGEYWDRRVQVDVVGLRDDDWIDLGECKWGPVGSVPSLIAQLDAKVRAYPNPHNATIARRAFVQSRPAAARGEVRWHDLEDLYGAAPATT